MARNYPPPNGPQRVKTVMVGVDKDKNSNYAMRWAAENLLTGEPNPSLILVHVRVGNYHSSGGTDGEHEADIQQLFATFRGFCTRKGIQLKEVAVDDTDVAKGLLSYVKANFIDNIVLGAPRGNALTRCYKKCSRFLLSLCYRKDKSSRCSTGPEASS